MKLIKDIKDINSAWVIVKHYNGNTYFHSHYARAYKDASTAKLYYDKVAA